MKKIFFFVVVMMTPLLTMSCGPYGPRGDWDRPGNQVCAMGYGPGGMSMGILFLIAVGVAIYFIVQSAKSKNMSGEAQETPLDLIRKRYAKGEITKEEFDRMKKELE